MLLLEKMNEKGKIKSVIERINTKNVNQKEKSENKSKRKLRDLSEGENLLVVKKSEIKRDIFPSKLIFTPPNSFCTSIVMPFMQELHENFPKMFDRFRPNRTNKLEDHKELQNQGIRFEHVRRMRITRLFANLKRLVFDPGGLV